MAWVRCMGGNTAKLAGTDKVPYLNRAIPFSANLEKDKLIGGSVAFNQLVDSGATSISTTSGRKYLTKINSVWSVITGGSAVSIVDDTADMVIDLTQMFGSTIANYIYTLESGTAGAGVAFFRSLFPEDYYAYNAGELMSVKTSAHKTYDSNNVLIGNYPLASNLELRGIPKLYSNNKLYYDGDIYESNGSVTRKYGIVDLGTLGWNYRNDGVNLSPYFYAYTEFFPSGNIKYVGVWSYTLQNAISGKYPITVRNENAFIDKTITFDGGSGNTSQIQIKDSAYTDAATFKAAMDGVYLVYELVTPTTETADSFINPQAIEAGGTEEYVDTRSVAIPVGHESKYYDVVFPE